MSRMVPAPDALVGKRFDVAVAKMLGISRSKAADLVDSGQARVLGREVARSSTLQAGETVEFDLARNRPGLSLSQLIWLLSTKTMMSSWSISL